MKKKGKVLVILGILSAAAALMEGCLYYSVADYPNPLFRWMFIFENLVKAFTFSSEIGLEDMAELIKNGEDWFQVGVAYAYSVAIFTAPYCTAAAVYNVLSRVLKLKSIRWWFIKERNIIIFGYNEEVKVLLQDVDKKHRVHLIATNIPNGEELELLRSGIAVYNVDCMKLPKWEWKLLASRIRLKDTSEIILFDSSAAANFSVYQWFHETYMKENLDRKVKFFCRCEDESTKRIFENYYDEIVRRMKARKEEQQCDFEMVSISELRISKMLEKHPLHSYYLGGDSAEGKTISNFGDQHEFDLHLLIVGFGTLGKQLLLQTMNLGVISSKNNILIDVVDFDVANQKNMFLNHFSEKYVQINEQGFSIPSDKADGSFVVRFHNTDIRHKQFGELLDTIGGEGNLFTYIALCVKNPDISILSMSEIERYLKRNTTGNEERKISVGIRMEGNPALANYVQQNNGTGQNAFVIEDAAQTIRLNDLLHDKLSADAKKFNYIYQNMDLSTTLNKDEIDSSVAADALSEEEKEEAAEKLWHSREIFRRNSSVALARHAGIRNVLLTQELRSMLPVWFGENGNLLKDCGDTWKFYGSEEELVHLLNDEERYPWIAEFVRLEHRRWCYYIASCGWKAKDTAYWKKDDRLKENACLCPWNELADMEKVKAETSNENAQPKYYACKYDLMPLLKLYLDEK